MASDHDLPPRSPFADDTSDIAPLDPAPRQRDQSRDVTPHHVTPDRLPSPFADDASVVYGGAEEQDNGQGPALDVSAHTLQLPGHDQGEGHDSRAGASSAGTEWSEVVVPFFTLHHYEEEKALSHGEYLERLRSGQLLLMQELTAWRAQCGISDDEVRRSAELLISPLPLPPDPDLPHDQAQELVTQQLSWKRLTLDQLIALIASPLP